MNSLLWPPYCVFSVAEGFNKALYLSATTQVPRSHATEHLFNFLTGYLLAPSFFQLDRGGTGLPCRVFLFTLCHISPVLLFLLRPIHRYPVTYQSGQRGAALRFRLHQRVNLIYVTQTTVLPGYLVT